MTDRPETTEERVRDRPLNVPFTYATGRQLAALLPIAPPSLLPWLRTVRDTCDALVRDFEESAALMALMVARKQEQAEQLKALLASDPALAKLKVYEWTVGHGGHCIAAFPSAAALKRSGLTVGGWSVHQTGSYTPQLAALRHPGQVLQSRREFPDDPAEFKLLPTKLPPTKRRAP